MSRRRPPWRRRDGDCWIEVPTSEKAAAALPGLAERVFLTTGRQDIAAFAPCDDIWFLVRLIDRPEEPLPLKHHELILARGPFDVDREAALMNDHGIDALVSKNSGGDSTYGKIAAARLEELPVVMIARPPAPPGETAETLEQVQDWIARQIPCTKSR